MPKLTSIALSNEEMRIFTTAIESLEVPDFLDTYNNAFVPPPKLYQRLCERHRVILHTLCTAYPSQSAKLFR